MQAMRATCTPPEIYFTCGGCRHLILALMGCNNVDTCLNRPNCTRLLEGIASRSLPLCSHTSCMSLDNSARAGFTSGCLTFCAASDFLVFCHIEWPASRPNTQLSHHPLCGADDLCQPIRASTRLHVDTNRQDR